MNYMVKGVVGSSSDTVVSFEVECHENYGKLVYYLIEEFGLDGWQCDPEKPGWLYKKLTRDERRPLAIICEEAQSKINQLVIEADRIRRILHTLERAGICG